MKVRILATCLTFFVLNQALSQQKPPLPGDYFRNFSYTFSKGFDAGDAASLQKEVRALASVMETLHINALQNFAVDDSAGIYGPLVYIYLCQDKFNEAQAAIKLYNRFKPAPAYVLPYGLFADAYARAASATQGARFDEALQQALRNNLQALPADFRNDIINSNKGLYNSKMPEKAQRQLRRLVDQTVTRSGGTMQYGTASSILSTYGDFHLWHDAWTTAEKVLYAIAPARVSETVVKIPMRDGIRLNAFVYRNEASSERVPAIVALSPYPTGLEALRGNIFATNGYIYVYVDNRGRRDSEGTFFPYENDAQDYYDIIDWVSKQPWCNGSVATSGGSYLGFAQWQAIRKEYKHPALKAINPLVSVGFGVDFPRMSHTFTNYALVWALRVTGKEDNTALFGDLNFWYKTYYQVYKKHIPFEKLDSVAGMPSPIFQKWVSHPDFDSYWKGILPKPADYAALDIPVLTITGYYDADQIGAFYYYNNHLKYGTEAAKAKHHILIGPYDHGGAQWQPRPVQASMDIEREAQIPIYKYIIRWFDWVLKGKEKPQFIQDKVNYFATGTGKWKAAKSFKDIAGKDTLKFYLTDATVASRKRNAVYALNTNPPASARQIRYTHDIASIVDSAYAFSYTPLDDSLYMASKTNLIFESQPLTRDIMVTGKIIPRLYMSLNVPDADYRVGIYEITPDGRSEELCYSHLRARYRHSGEAPELVKPGKTERYDFNDGFLYIKKIARGSKLRMTFENLNSPSYQKNYGFGGSVSKETAKGPRVFETTLQLSKTYPSRIDIPYTEIAVPKKAGGSAQTK